MSVSTLQRLTLSMHERWESLAPEMLVRYEDMSRRPGPTLRAIAAFLGLKPPRERPERAMRHSSFRVLRA